MLQIYRFLLPRQWSVTFINHRHVQMWLHHFSMQLLSTWRSACVGALPGQ